jgi:hypothetical protein
MTQHLTDLELVDHLDGRLAAERARHLSGCATCAGRADRMTEVVDAASGIDVPEPSPLFWQHQASRISEAIAADDVRRPAHRAVWGLIPRWAWTVALVLLGAGIYWLRPQPLADRVAPAPAFPVVSEATPSHDVFSEGADVDEAWAVVRTVAEDVGWDGANDGGVVVRPEAAERVVPQLSAAERSELARLIAEELRRNGA